jgi:dihydrofolate synthase / folylpolyglutamate synthase
MISYSATLHWLYSLQYRGMKFGLRNIRTLLRETGHPERHFPALHIAGTNGKGSTSAFLASILQEAGYRTGLYTSPHLVRFTERIRINGVEMPEKRLIEYAHAIRPSVEAVQATFFEATTCIAFQYFADEEVDIAVIETGLGGRLDATNTLRPLVSVITNIGLEHTEFLGTTLKAIAREKAGIIKKGIPVVTSAEEPGVLRVFKRTAERRKARFFLSGNLVEITVSRGRSGSSLVNMITKNSSIGSVLLGLPGEHQAVNAALAVAALQVVKGRGELQRAAAPQIEAGLRRVRKNTGLRARMEDLTTPTGRILMDVAHNPAGIETLVRSLRGRHMRCPVVVFGVMKDKDAEAMLAELSHLNPTVVAVAPGVDRSLPAAEVKKLAKRMGIHAVLGPTVSAGVRKALHLAGPETLAGPSRILITGSHYVVGEALSYLEKST